MPFLPLKVDDWPHPTPVRRRLQNLVCAEKGHASDQRDEIRVEIRDHRLDSLTKPTLSFGMMVQGSAQNPRTRPSDSRHTGEGAGTAAEDGWFERVSREQRDDRQANTDAGK